MHNRRKPISRMGMGTAAERTGVGWHADRCVGDVSASSGWGDSPHLSVRLNGAVHQWREDPPRKLSVGPG